MQGSGIKVYPYRWVVLGVFSFINLTIQVLWICYAPVAGPAAQYYHVSDMKIGLLAMVYMIVYIPAALPASWIIDRFGFRNGVGLGAVMLGVFGLLRGIFPKDYNTVMALTIGLALAQPLLLNSFTTLAAKWFPFKERAMVSGIAMAASFMGIIISYLLTPGLVKSHGMGQMQMIYGVAAAVSAVLFVILAREEPTTPASAEGFTERALMLDGLKMTLKQKDFWYCMVILFIGMGIFNGLTTWMGDMVRPRGMAPEQAGILGGSLLIGGIAGAAAIPTLSDYYHRRKFFMLLGMALSIPGMIGFIWFQDYHLLIASIFWMGFFMMGLGPIGNQYAAEITYPAPEGTSNGLLMLAGQISVVVVYGMEAMKEWLGSFTPSLILGAGLMAVNCVLIARLHESTLLEKMSGQGEAH